MSITPFFSCFLALSVAASGCAQPRHQAEVKNLPEEVTSAGSDSVIASYFPYDLNKPDHKTKLPEVLVEVSGLSYIDEGKLCMIQDEEAKVFIFDIAADSVTEAITFGVSGDFEGIEFAEKKIFTISTDGVLTEISHFDTKIPKMRKFQTFLTNDFEPEGLTWLPSKRYILFACKAEKQEKNDSGNKTRALYYFDMNTDRIAEIPLATIDLGDIQRVMFESDGSDKEKEKEWKSEFDPHKNDSFRPSGISVHPLTGEIFMIASVGKMLIVLNPETYEVVQARYLSREIFKQPEGICFDPAGNLFISNEGRDGRGNVLRFDYRAEN
ncbi:MAG: hypothetical protein R3C61_19035 [Bacteroidia bacterium]